MCVCVYTYICMKAWNIFLFASLRSITSIKQSNFIYIATCNSQTVHKVLSRVKQIKAITCWGCTLLWQVYTTPFLSLKLVISSNNETSWPLVCCCFFYTRFLFRSTVMCDAGNWRTLVMSWSPLWPVRWPMDHPWKYMGGPLYPGE